VESIARGVLELKLPNRKRVADRFQRDEEIERAMQLAVENALRERRRLKHPIVVWRDGQMVRLEPDDPTNLHDPEAPR